MGSARLTLSVRAGERFCMAAITAQLDLPLAESEDQMTHNSCGCAENTSALVPLSLPPCTPVLAGHDQAVRCSVARLCRSPALPALPRHRAVNPRLVPGGRRAHLRRRWRVTAGQLRGASGPDALGCSCVPRRDGRPPPLKRREPRNPPACSESAPPASTGELRAAAGRPPWDLVRHGRLPRRRRRKVFGGGVLGADGGLGVRSKPSVPARAVARAGRFPAFPYSSRKPRYGFTRRRHELGCCGQPER